MKKAITITITITITILAIIMSSCTNQTKSDKLNLEKTISTTNATPQVKFEIFNNIPKLQAALSQNGIGQLGDWKSDGMGGFYSITKYFLIGHQSEDYKPQNDLCYNLESDNEQYVKTLKLCLNINNKSQKKQAISKFKETIGKTFQSLSIKVPDGLYRALDKEKGIQSDNEQYKVMLKLEKNNWIDNWIMLIETK